MLLKLKIIIGCGVTLLVLLLFDHRAWAEWKIGGEANVFYTDDVSIFSASQRLALQEDPTQPVIDITDQGDDVVFEPVISVGRSFQPGWGAIELIFNAQGFVFAKNSEFNHGTYGLQIMQELPAEMVLRFRYHYGPNLFLGKNTERRTGAELLEEERVTTHFGTVELEREFLEALTLRVLSRYGHRSYNEMFAQRDTNFWTIGSHMEWEIHPCIELALGYHYERGLADGRNQPQFEEDVSYFNHYVAAELEVHVTEKTAVKFGFDFEKNTFTSGLPGDEHRNGNEKIYQGEVEVRHAVNEAVDVTMAYQRGQRKFSFEPSAAFVNTVWMGGAFRF